MTRVRLILSAALMLGAMLLMRLAMIVAPR